MTLAASVQFVGALCAAGAAACLILAAVFFFGALRGVDAALAALPPSIILACVTFGLTFWALMP